MRTFLLQLIMLLMFRELVISNFHLSSHNYSVTVSKQQRDLLNFSKEREKKRRIYFLISYTPFW